MSVAMPPFFMVPEPIPALGVCLKVVLLLLLAWVAVALMRGRSAAARHLVWASSLAGALALAALTPITPRVPVYVPVVFSIDADAEHARAGASAALGPAREEGAHGLSPHGLTPRGLWLGLEVLSTLWLAGAVGIGLWLATGHLALARILRRANPGGSSGTREWLERARLDERALAARIVGSAEIHVPMTWGVLRPVILVPAAAASWSAERLRAALLHELAHVARRDGLAQALASVACVTFWFNPLVWLAVGRMRNESERACDDRVLAAGVSAPDYADHLIAVARASWGMSASLAAAGMARSSGFERRIAAILDDGSPRFGVGARAALAILLACAAVLAPLSLLRMRITPVVTRTYREARIEQALSAPTAATGPRHPRS